MNDASFANVSFADFKLRFNQGYNVCARGEERDEYREQEAQRNKGHVKGQDADAFGYVLWLQMAGIGALAVEWRPDDHVVMTGPAEWEFSGTFDPATGAWARDRQDVA